MSRPYGSGHGDVRRNGEHVTDVDYYGFTTSYDGSWSVEGTVEVIGSEEVDLYLDGLTLHLDGGHGRSFPFLVIRRLKPLEAQRYKVKSIGGEFKDLF